MIHSLKGSENDLKSIPYSLLTYTKRIYNYLYSICIRKVLYKHKGVHFESPTTIVGGSRISVGENTYFSTFLELCAWENHLNQKFYPSIKIGKNGSFGRYNHISSIKFITIGDNFLTGRNVTICDNNHGQTNYEELTLSPLHRPLHSKGGITIGNNVWLGDKVTILGDVTIGDGVVVGANSVVTKSIPAYCIAGGNPAKILKSLI